MDPDGRFLGTRRLQQVLAENAGVPPKKAVEAVLAAVNEFAAGAPQSDDITVMAVRWRTEPA
jgi:sigma-B regulation protein RsbU (phosphoserine phosphatase)